MLELTTTRQKEIPIKIDDKEYNMVPYELLKFSDFLELQKFSTSLTKRADIESKMTESEIKGLESSINKFCKMVLPTVPKEIWEKLSTTSQMQILELFMQSVPQTEENGIENTKSSQDLQSSMASLPKSG